MQIKPFLKFAALIVLLLIAGVQVTLAEDNRINQVHHFGGDALFCTTDDGCYLLNAAGEQLWNVTQEAIDAALTAACEAGESLFIDAGIGTYGPNTIGVSCYEGMEPTLQFYGYDEWGKPNTMPFSPDYAPVNAPVESEEVVIVATPKPRPPAPPCGLPFGVGSLFSFGTLGC